MRPSRWLAANLIFWAGVPLGLTAWIMVADEQALRAGRISAQKLSQQNSYAIPLYSLCALTTLLVLAVNLILGLIYLVRKLASAR